MRAQAGVTYSFKFCPDCGVRLPEPAPCFISVRCANCGAEHFRNAKPCAGALVVRDGRVLLGRRAVDPNHGKWDIPGGFLNPWEHPAEAATREILEETGLHVRLGEVFKIVIDTYADRDYTLNLYYLADPIGGEERAADDIAELRWFEPHELPSELAFAHAREVLDAWARAQLPGNGAALAGM